MRRRGVGVGVVQSSKKKAAAFERIGNQVEEEQKEYVEQTLASFKVQLEAFARKHRKDINSDPVFRSQFQSMCSAIGVDPLASGKGFWAEMLGVGDFYFELTVQITEICFATRETNGGLIHLDELLRQLKERRSRHRQHVSRDDVRRSIPHLKILGTGFSIVRVGGTEMVQSVPRELSADHTALLVQAEADHNSDGRVIVSSLSQDLGWEQARASRAIQDVLAEGMAWIDSQAHEGNCIYFPALFFKRKEVK